MTITSHFRRAADHNPVTRSAASSVVSWTTPSANTTRTSHQQNLPTVGQLGQRYPTKASAPQTAKRSASTTISAEPLSSVPIPTVDEPIFAHSAAPNLTTHFHGPVAHAPYGPLATLIEPPFSESAAFSHFLSYRDFSSTIAHRESLAIADQDSLEPFNDIYLRIVHPYNTDAFDHFISKHGLSSFYSLLVTNLRNGFPLGEMPPIADTVIFKNHPSAFLHSDAIDKYLIDELDTGRMSGPFSQQHVERILRGPFFCSPLLVSTQTQQPGMPDKLRVCRHLSKGDKNTPSMNSHIHKEDFPTRFDTALKVADIVGFFPSQLAMASSFIRFTGLTSGGLITSRDPLLVALLTMGFTSGDPSYHGIHFW